VTGALARASMSRTVAAAPLGGSAVKDIRFHSNNPIVNNGVGLYNDDA
jgi:hypothetical protein